MQFQRTRRLRLNENIRSIIRETKVNIEDLIYPIFVTEKPNTKREIMNMPEQYQYSIEYLEEALKEVHELGIKGVIFFGVPIKKDGIASSSFDNDGIVQKAIRLSKQKFPDLLIIADVCLCQYKDDGHCGIIKEEPRFSELERYSHIVDNDSTLMILKEIALSYAKAGADIVAPSDMMDGRVKEIRSVLDRNGYEYVSIMAYSVKYASSFYSPFRGAAGSSPSFGDRRSYQMDYANRLEAIKQSKISIDEGADIIMVKPAMTYLDIVRDIKGEIPIAAYNVSGEYAMIKLAENNGLLEKDKGMLEVLTSIKRAGADIIITYFAKDMAKYIIENK